MMHLKPAIAALIIAAVADTGLAQTKPASTGPVVALVQAFSDARNRFDAKALDRLLTPDYVEISPRGEIDRRSAVLGFYAADKAVAAPPMTLSTEDVRLYGATAVVVGSVEYSVPVATGGMLKRTVRVTYVERRVGGRWLMASTQYTAVQPPKPAG